MKSKALRRKSVTIANSRWATYAVAGAATSLAGLATAEAEIHYSGPVDFRFTGTLFHQFPLDNGASLSFHRIDEGGGQGYAKINIPNSIGDFAGTAIGSEGSYLYASRLFPRGAGLATAPAQQLRYDQFHSQVLRRHHRFGGRGVR